ncbi:MAG: FAD:protein FMN transferase [Gammaproteobacteria bacterium]
MNVILKRYRFSISVFVVLIAAYLLFRTEGDITAMHEFGGATMGTSYSIKLVDETESADITALVQEVSALLTKLDREVMSTYSDTSELTALNMAETGVALKLSPEMTEVLALALEINRQTSGAFDVTVGPLVNRWGFGPTARQADRVPQQDEIDKFLTRVGSHFITLDTNNRTLRKNAQVYIDLSGIAKGYAVDRVAELFDSKGYASYFIEVGGELRIKGLKPGQQTWVPAIEKPVDTAPQVHNIFYANGESISVAGSGDYRNYFDLDGVHYSHEIDPVTGKPVTHNLASVYVITESAARADALATAFMVMGAEAGFALAQSLDLAVYFITKRAEEEGFDDRYTDRFAEYLNPKS